VLPDEVLRVADAHHLVAVLVADDERDERLLGTRADRHGLAVGQDRDRVRELVALEDPDGRVERLRRVEGLGRRAPREEHQHGREGRDDDRVVHL